MGHTACILVLPDSGSLTLQVHLKLPQEAMMVKAFCDLVRKVQAGEAPDQHWPTIAVMTQKIVCAIQLSAENDCQSVQLSL